MTEAEKQFRKAFRKEYRNYLKDNEDEPVDWTNLIQTKYCIRFNIDEDLIFPDDWTVNKFAGVIYTTRKQSIEEFINAHDKQDILRYLF